MRKPRTAAVFLILSAALILCGCNKGGEEALPLDSLEQTLWEGTLIDNEGSVTPISVAFSYENHGYYVIADYPTGFSYHNYNGKMIDISDTGDKLLLTGEWWISTMTQQKLILKEHPLQETWTKTLTLKRIRTL